MHSFKKFPLENGGICTALRRIKSFHTILGKTSCDTAATTPQKFLHWRARVASFGLEIPGDWGMKSGELKLLSRDVLPQSPFSKAAIFFQGN